MILDQSQSIQKQFGNVAANYSTSEVHATGEDLNKMVQSANLKGHEIVLDAGCGAGHTALAFAENAHSVIAYDLTQPMLKQVEKLALERGLTNIQTKWGNVDSLPFKEEAFDLVVSRYSAHHWAYPTAALREFARVLKPGGHIIMSDIVAFNDPTQDTFLQTIELIRDPSHVRDHSLHQWRMMFVNTGLQFEVIHQFEITLDFKSWVERMATPEENIAIIKSLLAQASDGVKDAFQLSENWQAQETFDFVLPGVVFKGWWE